MNRRRGGTADDHPAKDVWIVLLCAWILIGVGLGGSPSARINGVQVGGALLLVLIFVIRDRWRRDADRPFDLQHWLLIATIALLVFTLDYSGIRTRGLIINVSPLVALLIALLGRRL